MPNVENYRFFNTVFRLADGFVQLFVDWIPELFLQVLD